MNHGAETLKLSLRGWHFNRYSNWNGPWYQCLWGSWYLYVEKGTFWSWMFPDNQKYWQAWKRRTKQWQNFFTSKRPHCTQIILNVWNQPEGRGKRFVLEPLLWKYYRCCWLSTNTHWRTLGISVKRNRSLHCSMFGSWKERGSWRTKTFWKRQPSSSGVCRAIERSSSNCFFAFSSSLLQLFYWKNPKLERPVSKWFLMKWKKESSKKIEKNNPNYTLASRYLEDSWI